MKKLRKCTICGKIDYWNKNWGQFGSVAIEESAPEQLILTCSESCKIKAETNLNRKGAGGWKHPKVKNAGYFHILTKDGKNYPYQPSQRELMAEYTKNWKEPLPEGVVEFK